MGIFLVPVPAKNRQHLPFSKEHSSAVDRLWGFRQDGRPLERYVEEFSELAYLVNWPDAPLNSCFLAGIDEDTIRFSKPACFFSLVENINLILFLNGSDFEIEEVQKESCSPRPVPSETQAAWPVRQPPVSPTYSSSGYSPGVLPDQKPKPPKNRSTAKTRRPKKVASVSSKSPVNSATEQSKSPVNSATEQSKSPVNSAAEQSKSPVNSAAELSKSPVNSATEQPKSPVNSAAEQSKSPVNSAAELSKSPVNSATEQPKSPVNSAAEHLCAINTRTEALHYPIDLWEDVVPNPYITLLHHSLVWMNGAYI
ncbi:hypothetical protein DPX16_6251 [Anabarilius grahami]|uniref:Uncharacterized protein n=1 Tax=Anabarilius grahami TaxID=495550 RepID=A0A3N0YJA1_ANAGA|nr:hypothetical protein DPX16_6251 [Anabarilius grahami]